MMERRSLATQFRAADTDGAKYLEGYFSVFGSNYQLWNGATESIDPHAFDDAIANDDVRALINHDTTLVLGRTKSGTLELRVDDHGLWGRIRINDHDTDATNLWERVQRGDVDQCSFGFDILEEETEYREDGTIHWTVKRTKLYEVSPCTFPAYEETSLSARKAEAENIKKRQFDAFKIKNEARFAKWH